MRFRVGIHAGSGAPADALERLLTRLRGDESFRFSKPGPVITAEWRSEAPVAMESDERSAIGRRKVWDIVDETCETAPDLNSSWFAVSPQR
jgi:hypothetical protein